MNAITTIAAMRQTAAQVAGMASRLDQRGRYLRARDSLRLSDLLLEVAWQLEGWEREISRVPMPGGSDPARAGIDDKTGIENDG